MTFGLLGGVIQNPQHTVFTQVSYLKLQYIPYYTQVLKAS